MESAISLHQEFAWHWVRLLGSASESWGEMALNQDACLVLLACSSEGFAALRMEARQPHSAVAHSPHQGIWDEHMGDHLNLVYGVIHRDESNRRCEGWMELPYPQGGQWC